MTAGLRGIRCSLSGGRDSCEVSQKVSDGLTFWPPPGYGDPEGRSVLLTLGEVTDEGVEVGVVSGRRFGGLQSDEEAVEMMLTSR